MSYKNDIFLPYRKLLVSYKVKKIYMPSQFVATQQREMAMRNARKARFLVIRNRYKALFYGDGYGVQGGADVLGGYTQSS